MRIDLYFPRSYNKFIYKNILPRSMFNFVEFILLRVGVCLFSYFMNRRMNRHISLVISLGLFKAKDIDLGPKLVSFVLGCHFWGKNMLFSLSCYFHFKLVQNLLLQLLNLIKVASNEKNI